MTRVVAHTIARTVPGMNRLETAYAEELEAKRFGGIIREWHFQALTLKLANDTRYTPDFFVVAQDGAVECHETKGHMRDDAAVKLKVAARQFPFRFYLIRRDRKTGYFHTTDYTEGEAP